MICFGERYDYITTQEDKENDKLNKVQGLNAAVLTVQAAFVLQCEICLSM